MQAAQTLPPVGVVFDCDMGNSIDDALALCMLYGLDGKDEVRVVSVSTSKSNLKSAAFCDALRLFYSGGFSRVLPTGMADNGRMKEDTPMLTVPLSRKGEAGDPLYKHTIENLNDTAVVPALIRNALTAQHDGNAVVVLTGPATNLAAVLEVRGAKEIIASKVRFLAVMGGAYPTGDPEWNIKADIPAARKLFSEWPTPIVASGFEVGNKLLYPADSIENDFAWAEDHLLVDAYRAHDKMPYDAPTWDLTATLYAARPDQGYFQLSEPGIIEVLNDGRTRFAPASSGRHRYLIYDPAQHDRIIAAYRELVSAKPVVRTRRQRPVEVEPEKKYEKKPAAPAAKPAKGNG